MNSTPEPTAPTLSPVGEAPRRIRGTERLLSLSVLALAAAFGIARLGMWLVDGRFEGALPISLVLGGLLVTMLGAGLLMHVPSFELALATVAWCFCTSIITELSPVASARHIGSGPSHVPVYVALAFLSGVYALGLLNPKRERSKSEDPAARAGALLAFWTTAGGRMFERDGETFVPLLAGAVLLVLGTRARFRLRDLLVGPGRWLPMALAALLAWWSVAAAAGDNWRMGATSVAHMIVGLCLTWSLTVSLDTRGVRTAFAGLVFGLLTVHVLLAASVVEMLPFNEPIRIFGSRMSLFSRHPNQVAPMFAIGACLVAPLALRGRRRPDEPPHRLPRIVPLALFALSLAALAWTQSRGGVLATLAGLGAALLASRGWLWKRPGRFAAIALVLAGASAAVLVSPLGNGVRAKLEAQTLTQSAIGQRFHLWRSASAAVADHPLLGVGPSQYYVHARYAQPSYYDGTYQDVHPHSLFFAAAEGAGLPALLLILAILAGTIELGRRRIQAAPPGPDRRILIALFAALIAMIANNTVDLQGGPSLLPPFFWIALGLFAAAGRKAGTAPTRAPAAGALTFWVALVPLAALPLGSSLALDWAGRQPAWTAARIYEVVRLVHPWNGRAIPLEIDARAKLGQRREALTLAQSEAVGSPARLGAQLRYGVMLLEIGRVDEALELLERAQSLDPLGTRAGMAAMALARVHAVRGDEAAFREHFVRGLTLPEGQLLWLPHEPLPARPGDTEGSQRVGFRMGAPEGDGALVPADELLDALGEKTMSMVATDEVNARRLLGRVVDGYTSMGLINEALAFVDRYTEGAPPMFSMTALRIDLLCKQRDYQGAAKVFHDYPDSSHPYMTVFYLRGIGNSDDPKLQAEFRELPIKFQASRDSDLFFTAEQSAPVFETQAERALMLGNTEGALKSLGRALYHYPTAQQRLVTAEHFFNRAAGLGVTDAELLAALEILMREADLHRVVTGDRNRMETWARTLREAWSGEIAALDMPFELELVLRRAGPAGRAFGTAWNRTE